MADGLNNVHQIIHIVVDDKFIDNALLQFEKIAPLKNRAILVGEPCVFKYLKGDHIEVMSFDLIKTLLQSDQCLAVIFHSLPDKYLPLLSVIPKKKKVVWIGWGYDYYDRLLSRAIPNGLLSPETKQLMGIAPPLSSRKGVTRQCKELLRRAISSMTENPIHIALSRIDFFSPVLDTEYLMARDLNPWFVAKYIEWSYGNAEDDLVSGDFKAQKPEVNILIGNSSSPENNHLNIFNILHEKMDTMVKKIIVPLSYGNEIYQRKIIKIGHDLYQDKFLPLVDFMSKEDYMKLIDSCDYVIMNHYRQQAMGNILIMMAKGAKIYMNPQSPALKWLQNKGATIHSTDDIVKITASDMFTPISPEAKEKNKALVMKHWRREAQYKKTRHMIDALLQN